MRTFVVLLLVCSVLAVAQGKKAGRAPRPRPAPPAQPQTGMKASPPRTAARSRAGPQTGMKSALAYMRPLLRSSVTGSSCSTQGVLTAGGKYGWKYEFGTVGSAYENNENCWWRIQATSGKRVRLHFVKFHLEAHSSCLYDYVKIYDGIGTNAALIGTYCGNNVPADIISTGSTLYVKFKSDGSVVKPGFRIRYSLVSCKKLKVLTTLNGGLGTTWNPYGNYESCSWKIQVPSNKRLRLRFTRFDLEYGSSNCPYDKVKVYDGGGTSATLKGQFCGNTLPGNIVSTGNKVFVSFTSDLSIIKGGFWISYTVVSCKKLKLLTSSQAYFGTDGSPYGNYETCSWKIQIPGNTKKVRLHFTKFNLEFGNNNCPYDWVKVYGGSSTSALLIGKYCGTNMPADVISPTSTAYVAFKTDFSVTKPGFRIRYSLVSCSKLKVLTGPWGYLYTSGSHYENYETCSWRIQAPANKRVRIYFISFNLEFHSSCVWDSVKVYDGSNANAPLIGKYCGTNKPAGLIYSTGNSMFVTFTSDLSITKPGFRIKYWRV